MATLEVLDYLTRLEDELEARGVPSGERKLARREVKYLIEDLAFRFAAMDERVMPEDLDYARALEAVREPRRAATALDPARPRFQRVRRRKLASSLVMLLVFAVAVGGLIYLAGTQEADPLLRDFSRSHLRPATSEPTEPLTATQMANFTVSGDGGYETLRLIAEPVAVTEGRIVVHLMNPDDEAVWSKTFTTSTVQYAKVDVPAREGQWRVIIDFLDAYGAVNVNVSGIRPAV